MIDRFDLKVIHEAGAVGDLVRYGTPWHGRVSTVDGTDFYLYTGKKDADGNDINMPWPRVATAVAAIDYCPTRYFINHAVRQAVEISQEELAKEAAKGREWWDKAVIAGAENKLWGLHALGNDWLYADSTGSVWLVNLVFTSLNYAANTGVVDVVFTEFGVLSKDLTENARTFAHTINLTNIGTAGMPALGHPFTGYIGEHTDNGSKTLLIIDALGYVGVMEMVISSAETAPVITTLRTWADLGSDYTYAETVLQNETFTSTGYDPPFTCRYIVEKEATEAVWRVVHAQYTPAGTIEYITLDKNIYWYTFEDHKEASSCFPGDTSGPHRILNQVFHTECALKRGDDIVYQWHIRQTQTYYGTGVFYNSEGSGAGFWTTSLPYVIGVDYTCQCPVGITGGMGPVNPAIKDDLRHRAAYYSDAWRNSVTKQVDLRSIIIGRCFIAEMLDFIDREIFPETGVCEGNSFIPTRPAGAKPDDKTVLLCSVTPNGVRAQNDECTEPDLLSISETHDGEIEVTALPQWYI